MNQAAALGVVCKGSLALAKAARGLEPLLQLAASEVPGPVHVELCEDEADSVRWHTRTSGAVEGDAAGRALQLLERSRRPVLLVGSLGLRRSWGARAARLRIPVFTTASAKGVIDESGSHALGVFTGDGKSAAPESRAFAACDLVVALGLRHIEVLSSKPFAVPLLCADETSAELVAGYSPAVFWQTAASADYEALLSALETRTWGADLVATLRNDLAKATPSDSWLPAACFDVLNRLGDPYSLVVDTGSFCTIAEHCWLASPSRKFFGSSNGRFMGGSVPTAIGAAAADRATPVFCVAGDGGIRMYFADIALAVRERLKVCFVLMSDGRYGSVAVADRASKLSRAAVDVPRSSWLAAVEAMGCEATSADSPASFAARVGAWQQTGPLYIECRFDAQAYAAMTNDIR